MGDYRRFSDRAARPKAPIIEDDDEDDDAYSYTSSEESQPVSDERESEYEYEYEIKRKRTATCKPTTGIVSDEEDEDLTDEEDGFVQRSKQVFDGTIPLPNNVPMIDSIWGWKDDLFLVKWKGKGHRSNTWETADHIRSLNGGRKLDNFIAKWRPEEYEEDPTVTFQSIERVIAGQNGMYLCKWDGLGYAEATWVPEKEVEQSLIDTFLIRKSTRHSTGFKRGFQPMAEQPGYLAPGGQLRPYQLEGVNWLVYSWCNGTNAILADEMGLGKTIQSVSFLSVLYHSYGMTGPSLVVVPLSTIDAWKREFARWAPDLNVLCYVGDARSRTVIRKYEFPNAFNVLLTTYELVMKDRHILDDLTWKLLLIDEGHRLKSGGGLLYDSLQNISPAARFLVTGTPLQNSLQELWSLLHFLMPRRFADYEDFVQRYSVSAEDGRADERLASLHALLKPHLLRRMKKDVEQSLPTKTERILRVPLARAQRDIYKLVLTKNYRELAARQTGSSKNIGSLSNILVELKKVCNHPRLVTQHDVEELVRSCGKLVLLDQLLPRLFREGHRVLIFSQMVRMLDVLSAYMHARGFKFQRIDGGTGNDARRKAIDAFNAPGSPDQCFLLSTRAGGLGINLGTADTVIIYDSDWNPQNDLQAMARAHRIGQTRPVSIFRLVSRGTVEETILERAKQKMVLDHLVIQSSKAPVYDRQELQAILQFGAQAIFKNDDTSEDQFGSEAMAFDLDEIMAARGIREDGSTGAGEKELLGQFHVAEFSQPGWEKIIPEAEIDKIKKEADAEEKFKQDVVVQQALLTSATRRRNRSTAKLEEPGEPTIEQSNGVPCMAESLSSDKNQTKALVASLLQWGSTRPDKLAEFPSSDIALLEQVSQREKSKGATFTNGYYLSVAQLRDRLQTLAGLHGQMGNSDPYSFRINDPQRRVKSVMLSGSHRWHVPSWTIIDDAHLLAGVYLHGFGNWAEIIDDDRLKLTFLKEPFSNADPKQLPKALHLGRRVDFIIHALGEDKPVKKRAKEPAEKPTVEKPLKQTKLIVKQEQKPEQKLKHFFKPVRTQLSFLASLPAESVSERLDEVCKALRLIGQHINSDSPEYWGFVCNAWPTEITPEELVKLYSKLQ